MKAIEALEPGDVLVIKGAYYNPHRVTRITFVRFDRKYLIGTQGGGQSAGGADWSVDPSMVARIEPRQHGWTG